MATWLVSEPWLILQIEDQPLGYQPARGSRIDFRLSYRQSYAAKEFPNIFGVGTNWSCSFRAYVFPDPFNPSVAYLHKVGANVLVYNVGTAQVRDGSILTVLGGGAGYQIAYRDGSVDTYSTAAITSDGPVFFFLTTSADPTDNANSYTYSTNSGIFRLDTVTDPDGNVTRIYYENGSFPAQITKVVDPYLRTNLLYYDSQGYLTNSIDPIGLSSSFAYDAGASRGWITNMVTPHGATKFSFGTLNEDSKDAFALVTLPTGGKHFYLYRYSSSFLSSWTPTVPDTTPFSNKFEQSSYTGFNSFYWSPLQYVALSTADPNSLTTTDYLKARMRHWLTDSTGERANSLSIERAPSPDGTTEGQLAWYDFENKSSNYRAGSSDFPSFVAQVLPDGSTHYSYSLRGPHLNVTNEVETYTALNGSVALRTNIMKYAGNATDLLVWTGPNGEQVVSNYFAPGNTIHKPDASYDALNHEALYTYNGYGQLTSIKTPAGLTSTNIYYSGGGSINRLATNIDLEISRTNSYAWSDGLVATHTDPRRLVTTSYWDKLQRFVGMSYPDGSTISNIYTALDVTAHKDRLGQWSYSGFNGIRQIVAATNENGVVTRYGYCDCGALLYQTNAWNTPVEQDISYGYDLQGNRTYERYADGYNITNWFNALRQLYQTADGAAYKYLYYNNQGLLTNTSNAYGTESATIFDNEDRDLWVRDANGVTITNAYDSLGRLMTRTYPDHGVEQFGYSARGMIVHTNQIGFASHFGYDEAGRKIVETNANSEIIRYTNNAAGDLLSLTDGKVQTTKWNYDEYGHVTNKLDQAGTEILRYKYDPDSRLTNRWSKAKGDTKYAYDPVGSLTNIDYPSSPDVSFSYDWLNRVTNMVDAIGTTKYTYTGGDQVFTEDGPYASDIITNTHVNRLRTQLTLQQPTGLWTNLFIYDAAKRLTNVTSPAGSFGYTLGATAPSSGLIRKLLLPNASSITNTYDSVARLTGTYFRTSAGTLRHKHEYTYDPANERTNEIRGVSTNIAYAYDKIGQLVFVDSTRNADDHTYSYDAAWNLTHRSGVGFPDGFAVDSKNQLANNPGLYNAAYDDNGNLTYFLIPDPFVEKDFAYDDENRLIQYTYLDGLGDFYETFSYDGLGRLRENSNYHYDFDNEEWVADGGGRRLYDGMRVIQERDAGNTPGVSYTRGTDLSGNLEGAGGIGGLLAQSTGYSSGNWPTRFFYFCDGSGNITTFTTSSETSFAIYDYDAFGNTPSGPTPVGYGFSSKELIGNTGLYYYGYRFYDPNLQRWINRDPLAATAMPISPPGAIGLLAELSFNPNLFIALENAPTGTLDPDGRNPLLIIPLIIGGLCLEGCSKKPTTPTPPSTKPSTNPADYPPGSMIMVCNGPPTTWRPDTSQPSKPPPCNPDDFNDPEAYLRCLHAQGYPTNLDGRALDNFWRHRSRRPE